MSKYTAEQVNERLQAMHGHALTVAERVELFDMASNYAALLREREEAKASVTEKMVERAITAWFDVQVDVSELDDAGTNTRMRAALEAVATTLASARVPDGWQMVPLDPTDAMIDASMLRIEVYRKGTLKICGSRAWAAMLASAPKPEKE